MKLYVYCLVEDLAAFDANTRGILGAEVRLLQLDELAALVSDCDSGPIAVTRENALDHAATVRSVLDRTTPLPFRFGTVVTEEQLRSYVAACKPALQSKFAHLRDAVEMSVKIIWKLESGAAVPAPAETGSAGAGTTFLAEKRRELKGSELRTAQAAEIAGWLHEAVAGLIRDELVTIRPAEKLVLAAAHLVGRDKISAYKQAVGAVREERPELHFLVSGPWPPYTFANIELELKTQFGVS